MPGLFQGLEIGKRALLSHQVTLQTIGHNIANVNTPGFTRQRVLITATRPEELTYGSVGTGITVDDVRHVRDVFLRSQFREANKALGEWSYKERTMTQIESILNEPQTDSMNDLLNDFWNAWSALSTAEEATSASSRNAIVAEASKLINGLHQLHTQLTSLRDSIDDDLNAMTSEINELTTEIANINQQVVSAELGGNRANDLRDERDRLIDRLSTLIDVRTKEKSDGSETVSMGAMALVDGSSSFDIGTVTQKKFGVSTEILVWQGTSIELTNLSGELAGLTQSRDEIIPGYLDKLNELARSIVEEVNAIHRQGYGDGKIVNGVDFFDPNYTDAATIRLNQEILTDINKIAASASIDGDNLIALQLSGLRNVSVMANGSSTIDDFYHSIIGNVGIETSEASSFTGNYELLVHQTENSRLSIEGVSLDEEMANLVKFQHAYDAAARVITTMDEALDTVILGMGRVGL
ncbi:MAG: flagellar hook-associated protein FlgK [Candidatus Zixiibacteriota bacterium]|nr:MAG: flagellar hook-associated protein FlgK [candidate division Zixibacteria bacterium]